MFAQHKQAVFKAHTALLSGHINNYGLIKAPATLRCLCTQIE